MSRIQISDATWWKIIFVLFAILVSLNAFGDGLGRLEGRFWPVKDHAKLFNLRENSSGAVVFDGTAEKHRDCDLIDIKWFYVSPRTGNLRELDLVMRDRPQYEFTGKFNFRNWELYLSPSDLLAHTRAYAWHDCHPMFSTVTVFFEGENGDGRSGNEAVSGAVEKRPVSAEGYWSLRRPH